MKRKQLVGIAIAAIIFVIVGMIGAAGAASLNSTLSELSSLGSVVSSEPYNSVAIIDIAGTISSSTTVNALGVTTSTYDQSFILNTIAELEESNGNVGIILRVDSTGGEANAADAVYLALERYKENTGRLVYAYAENYMASGAYYISCAADRITANRNAWVGSIGVYINMTNYKELYDKLGVKPIYIKSSENKAMGNGYDELTEEQVAIYQGLVDTIYDQFLGIVCDARGYTRDEAEPICDGRVYTTNQCLENGLIDDVENVFEDYVYEIIDELGASDYYYPQPSTAGFLSNLFSALSSLKTKSETELLLETLENSESGVPMLLYVG